MPGVYIFEDESKRSLYVGKSKNLKSRVKSYFTNLRSQAEKTKVLIKQITKVNLVPTPSDFEAILLESRLIRILQPRYNSRLRDDKSPLYIVITSDKYPKIGLLRRRQLFPANGLNHQPIARIFGPFLSMSQAAMILKRARRLFPFCTKRTADGRACFYTQIGLCPGACTKAISASQYQLQIRRLIHLLDGNFTPLRISIRRKMQQAAESHQFEEAAKQRDLLAAFDQLLSLPVKEDFNSGEIQAPIERLATLSAILSVYGIKLPVSKLTRIEAYDISHLGGRQQTASMVVFTGGEATPAEFRHFRIYHDQSDDAALMAQILQRRLLHPEWNWPQLLVIDGGEPQLRAIQKQFNCTNYLSANIPFIGLAKVNETIVIAKKPGFHHLNLPPTNSGLLLLRDIRDHAHRFARKLHHKLRSSAVMQ